jgi:hypothetical protein
MHLYTPPELQALFGRCEVLDVAGRNATTYEGSKAFDELAADLRSGRTW